MTEQTTTARRNYSITDEYIERFPKSAALYEEAKACFPRGTTHDTRWFHPFPMFFTHAKGGHKWNADGDEIIDYWLGHTSLILGNANPILVETVTEQIKRSSHYGGCHEHEIEWANLIKQMMPSIELVEFCSSGTEADMMGIRCARAFTGKDKLVKFQGQYFGWSDSPMAGIFEPWEVPFSGGVVQSLADQVVTIPCNDAAALEQALSKRDAAALLVEPPGAHIGMDGIDPSFYKTMRELCDKYDTLLMFDEVCTGFRFAPGGAQEKFNVRADLTALGKAVSGGVGGAGALGGRRDVMNMLDRRLDDPEWNRFKRVHHSGTWNGYPMNAAVGAATLKVLASGEPQKYCDKIADGIRKGCEQEIRQRGVDGCAYGVSSVFDVYLGPCPKRDECDRGICRNPNKAPTPDVWLPLNQSLMMEGVHAVATFVVVFFGTTCVEHTEEDVEKTVSAFGRALDRVIGEGLIEGEKKS